MDKLIANRYLLVSNIGTGGMADVYKAIDTILNREVAVKILRGELAHDPMTLLRFQREASAASKLSHPNVVDVYDVGESEGRHYIVMEYVRGRTLKQLIAQRGALHVEEAIDIMLQLTDAVAMAHAKHIIHRDIKPQNVLVKDDGTVKITDFGIAVAHDAVQLTQNHTVMGSAHYLAPETTRGEAPTIAVDIYALGIVFYELLSGTVPFHGNNPTEIAVRHLREKMPYIRDFNPTIPQSVENIILKATAKRVEQRYGSAQDMIEDLKQCLLPQNRDVARLELVQEEIAAVKVKDGHLHVETKKKPRVSRRKQIAFGIIGGAAVLALSITLLFAGGVFSLSGLLGVEVPNVIEHTRQEAIALLAEQGIGEERIEIEEVLSDEVEKDKVVAVSPNAGERLKKEDKLVLRVSRGGHYTVENYVGWTLSQLQQHFAENEVNIRIEKQEKPMSDVDRDVILSQDLSAGEQLDPQGDNVLRVEVSVYPSFVIAEDLIGMELEEARELLKSYGAAVVTQHISEEELSEEERAIGEGRVVRCTPSVGSTYVQEGADSYILLYYY